MNVDYHTDKKGINPGIIVAIVLGLLIIIGIAVFFAIRYYRLKRFSKEDKMDDLDELE